MEDSEIQRTIDFHKFENWLCTKNQGYRKYRDMENNLKEIEVKIETCNDILQLNELSNRHEQEKTAILDYLHKL